jgi:hypothetical protein
MSVTDLFQNRCLPPIPMNLSQPDLYSEDIIVWALVSPAYREIAYRDSNSDPVPCSL